MRRKPGMVAGWLDVTEAEVEELTRRYAEKGYPPTKWVLFCGAMLDRGWKVTVYGALSTVSKYVDITRGGATVRVRFSNHKPNRRKQESGEYDYVVGVGHTGVITTDAVIAAIDEKHGREK